MRKPSAVVFIAAVLTCSCGTYETSPGTPVHFHQNLARNQPVALDVNGDIGVDIRVTGSTSRDVTLDAIPTNEYSALRLTTSSHEGWLMLRLDPDRPYEHRWFFLRHADAKITLHVPHDVTLSVRAVNGPIRVDSVRGPLSVHLVNGPISVDDSGNVLALHAVNGPIDVTIADTSGIPNVDVADTNGSIDVSVPKNFKARIDARTTIGPLDQEVESSQGPGTLRLRLVAGPITIEGQ